MSATQDPKDLVRGRAHYMLAKKIAKCEEHNQDGSCAEPLAKADTIRALLRTSAQTSAFPTTQLDSIRGLGLCGESSDISLLQDLAKKNSSKWFGVLLTRAEKAIHDREK